MARVCRTKVPASSGSSDLLTLSSRSGGHSAMSGASIAVTRWMLSATAWCSGQLGSSSASPCHTAQTASA